MSGPFGSIPVESNTDQFGGVPVSQGEAKPQQSSHVGKNFAAGFGEGVTGIPGSLVDSADKILDPGRDIGDLVNTVGGWLGHKGDVIPTPQDGMGADISHTLNRGLGLVGLNPEDVPANTSADRIARLAGTGATALLAPEAAPEDAATMAPRIAQAVRRMAVGTGSGAAGAAAGEGVPDTMPRLKNAVQTATALATSLLAETPGAVKDVAVPAVKKYVAPFTQSGREGIAANTIRSRATNPEAVTASLENPAPQLVPGSQPTTFQQTGDLGLGSLERESATRNPPAFIHRRADQNSARMSALQNIQSGADPDAVGTFLRGQFRNFDDQTQQHLDGLMADAQSKTEALGGNGVPEEHGAAIRGSLQNAENLARGRERSLWQAVDPDRNLVVGTQPTVDAAKQIASSLSPSAKPMSGEESAIFNVAGAYKPQMPFADLSDLRSRVSSAMREELMTNGMSPAYARLTRLRGAIQNNLSDAATNQAANDAVNVANGSIAPEDTILSKIKGWANDYYATKAAQSGATGGAGAGASPFVRPRGVAGADGAGFSPQGGFASPPGNQGLPSEPQPFDQSAADRLAAATQATKERAQTFGAGPISQTLAKAGTQDVYRLPEARVPQKFFYPGPGSFQDVQKLRNTVGDANALPILQDYAASSLRRVAERPDGTLDPAKVTSWQTKHSDALRAFPELDAKFSTAADASQAITDAAQARKAALDDYRSSTLGKLIGAQDADAVTKTVGNVFGKPNSAQAMGEMVQAVAKNPEAQQGLRQAVADHISNRFISNTEAGTSGQNLFKADQFQSFVRQNRPALSQVFNPDEMKTLDAIAADLKQANRSISASKLPGQSNTAQDIYGTSLRNPNASVLDRAITEELGASAGALAGHVAGGTMLGWLGARVANAARGAGMNKVNDLISEAMLNPDLARDLLRRVPAKASTGYASALAARLRRIAIANSAIQLAPQRSTGQ